MSAILPRQIQAKTERGAALLGVGLNDVREETFCLMVADGIAMSVAFQRSGFTSENTAAPSNLFHLDRIQKRVNDILEARRTTGVVTLNEVTDMLHRVFVGAWHKEEYSAAHNAAFSLARLYGHVTDKSSVEVIRRPSRDPDAPSEQALSSWVNSLPIIEHDAATPEADSENGQNAGLAPLSRAPAELLGNAADNLATPATSSPPAAVSSPPAADNLAPPASDLASISSGLALGPGTDNLATAADTLATSDYNDREKPSDFNGLELCSPYVQAPGRPENGTPAPPVTGTPTSGAHSAPLGRAHAELLGGQAEEGTRPRGVTKKGAPLPTRQVPGYPEGFEWPDAKDLF